MIYCAAEGCPSGLWCRSRKAVCLNRAPRVRIPPLPPDGHVASSPLLATSFCTSGRTEESHRGLVGATGNRVCPKGHRGFESHLLRHPSLCLSSLATHPGYRTRCASSSRIFSTMMNRPISTTSTSSSGRKNVITSSSTVNIASATVTRSISRRKLRWKIASKNP